jgi:hypothetical protein
MEELLTELLAARCFAGHAVRLGAFRRLSCGARFGIAEFGQRARWQSCGLFYSSLHRAMHNTLLLATF